MDFFTSDLHLNHFNVIRFCNRPFNSLEEMNSVLIENWNKKVKSSDTVYVLGDFIFMGNSFSVRNILQQLNGKKILIIGDHDKPTKNIKELEQHQYYFYKNKDIMIALFHWCIRNWQRSHYNSWHLYGHSHGRLSPIGKSWDVGVDNNKFEPLSLDEIINIMESRPDNINLIIKRKDV